MSRLIIVVAVAVSIADGWYFGYIKPVAQDQRKILKQYEVVRNQQR